MKKRILSVIMAATMAFTMAVGTFTVVNAADSTPSATVDAEGNGTTFGLVNPTVTTEAQGATVSFSVPISFTVGLDPFQAGDKSGSQIYTANQGIYNKSNIPIRVVVKAGVVLKDAGVTLKTTAGDVVSTDITKTTKDAYIELVAEKATATADRSGAVVVETVKLDGKDYATEYVAATGADTKAKTTLKSVPASAGAADLKSQVCFALQAATYTEGRDGTKAFSALAENNTGVGSFRFMGSLNANAANWSSADMEVKVVYDVNGMSSGAYTALMTDQNLDAAKKAANVYSVNDAN